MGQQEARPISFSGPMVPEIRAGRKTQTRRIANPQPDFIRSDGTPSRYTNLERARKGGMMSIQCPYGQPGDRLYVKEAWRTLSTLDGLSPAEIAAKCIDAGYVHPWAPIQYEADGTRRDWMRVATPIGNDDGLSPGRYRHARFMPRWASRLTLELTCTRMELLQDISESDAVAEGIVSRSIGKGDARCGCRFAYGLAGDDNAWASSAVEAYQYLWDSLHGDGSWDRNPFVWRLEFRLLSEEPLRIAA